MKIPYGKQSIEQDDIDAVVATLKSEFLTQGPAVAQFEQVFAQYVGAKYAVAVANGTAALHLAAMALGVKQGDRVITTPITFAASANGSRYCGADIDFCDINADTFLIDLDLLEQKLAASKPNTYQGLVVVDFAGKVVNLEQAKQIADKYGLWLVEDACHAPGGYFIDAMGNEQRAGNGQFADLSIFSFHPVKHIATGEGGMITTNSKELYEKLLLLRTHGITREPHLMTENHGGWYYQMIELGYNYRMCDMQAALGLSQTKKADKNLQRRKQIAQKYIQELAHLAPLLLLPEYDEGHAWHLFVIRSDKRDALYSYLREQEIYTQVHYIPLHTMPYYAALGHKKEDYPFSESYYEQCLSIPMYHGMTEDEQNFVIDKIKAFFGK